MEIFYFRFYFVFIFIFIFLYAKIDKLFMDKYLVWHSQAIKLAIKRLFKNPLTTLLSLLAMGVAFAVPGLIFLLILSGENLFNNQQHPQNLHQQTINIFLKKNSNANDNEKIISDFLQNLREKYLKNQSQVDTKNPEKNLQISWKFIPQNQAFEIVKQELNLPMLKLSEFPENPLPDSFEIIIENGNFDLFQNFLNDIHSDEKISQIIELVQSDGQWQQQLEQILKVGKILLSVLSSFFAIGLVAIIFNAIRSQVIANFDEIEISLFIGSTKDYVCRPFYYFGILSSVFGAILGIIFLQIAISFLQQPIQQLSEMLNFGGAFELSTLSNQIILVMLGLAIFLGSIGAFLSVNLSLRKYF